MLRNSDILTSTHLLHFELDNCKNDEVFHKGNNDKKTGIMWMTSVVIMIGMVRIEQTVVDGKSNKSI